MAQAVILLVTGQAVACDEGVYDNQQAFSPLATLAREVGGNLLLADITPPGTSGTEAGLAIQGLLGGVPLPAFLTPWQYTIVNTQGVTNIPGAKVYGGIKNVDNQPQTGVIQVTDDADGDMLFNEANFATNDDMSESGIAVNGLTVNLSAAPVQYGVLVRWK